MRQGPAQDQRILLLSMGGTIDAEHTLTERYRDETLNEGEGGWITQVSFSEDKLRSVAFLEALVAESGGTLAVIEICRKDSKDVTRKDLQAMRNAIQAAEEEGYGRIIITFGTDAGKDLALEIAAHELVRSASLVVAASIDELSKDDDWQGGGTPRRSKGLLSLTDAATRPLQPGDVRFAVDGEFGAPQHFTKIYPKNPDEPARMVCRPPVARPVTERSPLSARP